MDQSLVNNVIQFYIMVSSAMSIYMISKNDENSWKGFILALTAQPFWFYSSYMAGQWGMMLLSIWYTIYNLKGLANFKPELSLF